ncbi:MAG TPA: hypothetical protein VFE78_17515 [Gemmataceae bacterium]|jgi:hypothetical protein|nr:hypothetical protein [Gemmataceae bacterium]
MRRYLLLGAPLAAAALVISSVAAADALKSGPQVGSSNIFPFNPLHATGPDEGKKLCLV